MSMHPQPALTAESFEALFMHGFEGACLHAQGLIQRANPALEAIFGAAPGALNGLSLASLVEPGHAGLLADLLARADGSTHELKAQGPAPLLLEARFISLGQGQGLALLRDLTERRAREAALRQHALYDAVTGLPNRSLLLERLGRALGEGPAPDSILLVGVLDLDRFKMVNQSLGQGLGDGLLRDVARRIQRVLRQSDLLARLGGDSFGLVLAGFKRREDTLSAARKVLEALQAPFTAREQPVHLEGSLGYALYPGQGPDAASILRQAEVAMLKAKTLGRNRVQGYEEGMEAGQVDRLSREQELRLAIERCEFELFYQPQVDGSGQIQGMEALVRWRHPQKGLLMPDTFIPLAEETRLILPLGDWLLHEACRQGKAWLDQGLAPVSISVNLSAQQFQKPDLPGQISRILEQTGFLADYLDLEITESMAMQDPYFAMAMLKELVSMNLSSSLDDFGKGYSSLAYLMRFPVKTLKLDQSFVQEIGKDEKSAAIIRAAIDLAHQLGMKVVAEGVETREQLEHLRGQGCDKLQGFLFSRALPAAEVALHLAKGKIELTF
jgi:diguanylate cyclase (GGDEF)-like protein